MDYKFFIFNAIVIITIFIFYKTPFVQKYGMSSFIELTLAIEIFVVMLVFIAVFLFIGFRVNDMYKSQKIASNKEVAAKAIACPSINDELIKSSEPLTLKALEDLVNQYCVKK
ncbi:hypothetical protein [Hydromonas duriensis]|uniref:Uncharacterized protein n=1 Tax=Hydromonas duriensis TaxID=1527608 RepID=A0A4R6Y4Y3_9BURK|nr:hypothetical protein [Hydromonas duriensis]TDR28957.1 hypothetical protein DFR44_13026 [Hydromonas duriensis]